MTATIFFINQDILFLIFVLADTFTCPILGPLVPLFWISGDVSSRFQSQSGYSLIHITEANIMYIPWDQPVMLHVANILTVSIVGWQFKMVANITTYHCTPTIVKSQPHAQEPFALPVRYAGFPKWSLLILHLGAWSNNHSPIEVKNLFLLKARWQNPRWLKIKYPDEGPKQTLMRN